LEHKGSFGSNVEVRKVKRKKKKKGERRSIIVFLHRMPAFIPLFRGSTERKEGKKKSQTCEYPVKMQARNRFATSNHRRKKKERGGGKGKKKKKLWFEPSQPAVAKFSGALKRKKKKKRN